MVMRIGRNMSWKEIARIMLEEDGPASVDDDALRKRAASLRKRFERVKLIQKRGDWKKNPNNPIRRDGVDVKPGKLFQKAEYPLVRLSDARRILLVDVSTCDIGNV